MFLEPCIMIYVCNKEQHKAHFFIIDLIQL
jgi:hypothetical protein